MDQKSLYTVLNNAGCKVLSFEDYPENDGSWRANFLLQNTACEVVSNRKDFYLIFRAKSINNEFKKIVECKTVHNDEFDLICVSNWFDFSFASN